MHDEIHRMAHEHLATLAVCSLRIFVRFLVLTSQCPIHVFVAQITEKNGVSQNQSWF